jgi:hypothetical protein
MSRKCKRCQGGLTQRKVYSDHYQKGTSRSNYNGKEDNVNYYKSVYPSFIADDENRSNFEISLDNNDIQNVQMIAIPLAIDDNFNANIPKSLASYINQASKSQNVLQENNGVIQLLTVGNAYHVGSNGFKKQLIDTRKEAELNKDIFGKPSNDETGYIHAENQNELNTNMNTLSYSHLPSDTSTNPSLQYALLRSDNMQEYYHPYDSTAPLSQNLDEKENSPPEGSMYSKSVLSRNDLYTDKTHPQQTTYDSHRHDNAQTTDSDINENRHENIYSKHEEENEYKDVYNTYSRCSQVNSGLMHNTTPVTNYEVPPISHTSKHTLKKPTESREDIMHNEAISDILLYPSSDNRRLMQGKPVPQNGLTSSSHVHGNPVLKHNTMTITNSELPPIRYASEYTLNKPTGTSEYMTHNTAISDIILYPSSDNIKLLQGKFLPQNSLTSSPYVQEPRSNMQRYYPGSKPSAVLREDGSPQQIIPESWQVDGLPVQIIPDAEQEESSQVHSIPDAWQEDGLLVQSIPDTQLEDGLIVHSKPHAWAKETSTRYNKIPDVFSHEFKFLTPQDGMWKKDSALTTANSLLPLPTANCNTMFCISHKPYDYRDLSEELHNMDSPKLNIIAPKHDDDPAASYYFIQKNKIPSHQLPYMKEINELNEGLQFTQNRENTASLPYVKETDKPNKVLQFMQYRDNSLSHNCKASTITNVPKRTELMTDHSQYTEWVANTSPNRDEPPRYLNSIDGRNTVLTNLPFQISTYNTTESDDMLSSPQKPVASQHYQKISTPSNNINVESMALQSQLLTSMIQSQLARHIQPNYELTEGTNNVKFSASEKGKCGASTVIQEISDSSKCTPSTAVLSQNKERSEILRLNSSEVRPSLKIDTVSDRTKNTFSHMFRNTENDSRYFPASVITSLEHTSLSPTPSRSTSVQARSKSEDPFRQTANNPLTQYPAKPKESFTGTYSVATFPPHATTVTMGTYLPETYTEMTIMDDHKSKTIMGQDKIPTLKSNGDYKTPFITSEENMNDVSNSTTQLPHGFQERFSDEITEISELFPYDTNTAIAEKEMKEKWNTESEQSTTVMPNLYDTYVIQDDVYPTTNATAMHAIPEDKIEPTDHTTDLLNNKLKIEFGPVTENIPYQPIITAKITQQQDTHYNSSTTMTELLTEKPYNYVSDVADIKFVTAKRQDEHSTRDSTAPSSDDNKTNTEGLVLPDKRVASENEGNYDFSTATALLPGNTTITEYINTQPPERLVPTQKESLNEFSTTMVMPRLIEDQDTTEKRKIKITDTTEPKKGIKYKEKVSTYLTADKPIIKTNAGHGRKQVIFEAAASKLDKTTMAHKLSQNYKQINAQKDIQNTLKMKTHEKYKSPETLTSERSRAAQETYQTTVHISNKTNKHASIVPEKTTFQTTEITSEITNGMSETSFPTERSDISQSVYFTTPYATEAKVRITADLHRPNTDNSWILKDALQYLHTDNYDTSQTAIFTTTPYPNYNSKMRSTLNAAVGGWNQNIAQDVPITQHRTYFNDTDTLQDLITTSEDTDDRSDSDALYFIIPTLSPQQNKVTSNNIQLREAKLDGNTEWFAETQNKQDAHSMTGVTSSLPKVKNHITEQELVPHPAELRSENINADILCNYTANSQSTNRADYLQSDRSRIAKHEKPKKMTVALLDYKVDDPLRVTADHKQPEYGTESHRVLQSQVVTEQTEMTHGESKKTRYIENYNTNAVKQSDEDVLNKTNVLKKTLMLLLQNNDKIKLLLDSPNSETTSAPSTSAGKSGQSHLSKELVMKDQGQTQDLKSAFGKLTPANLDYNSVEMSDFDRELLKNVIMDSIKSKDLPLVSLPEKKRQTKSSQDLQTAASERCKIIHTSEGKHKLKYQDKLQQPSISKKEHSSAFQAPSLKVSKSETTKPKQNLKLKAGVIRSDDITDTVTSLAHLPQQSDTRMQRSTCGPWMLYKNYFCMPVASPTLNDHLLLSENEHTNTVPTSIYEINITSDPEHDYEMDASLESDKAAQDLFLNSHNHQSNTDTNFQHSDTLSEETFMREKNVFHKTNKQYQNPYDDSMTDIYNVLDSPQLFRLRMYKDKASVQPKLYTKRMSNSYHNTENLPKENYQQVIQNNKMDTRPVFWGNWKKYQGLQAEIIQPNPSEFKTQNYNNQHTQYLSNMNNNEENTRTLLVFRKTETNKDSHDDDDDDDDEKITYSKPGKKKYHKLSEQEILKRSVSQFSSFGRVSDESKDHEDNSEEFISPTSSERDLRNVNHDHTILMPVSDISHNNIFSQHHNNYKIKVLSEKMQKIPQNLLKYSSHCKHPIFLSQSITHRQQPT